MQLSIDKDMVDSQGMLTLWNLMDTMNSLKKIVSNPYYRLIAMKKVSKILTLNFIGMPLGEDLLVESNFAPNGKPGGP